MSARTRWGGDARSRRDQVPRAVARKNARQAGTELQPPHRLVAAIAPQWLGDVGQHGLKALAQRQLARCGQAAGLEGPAIELGQRLLADLQLPANGHEACRWVFQWLFRLDFSAR